MDVRIIIKWISTKLYEKMDWIVWNTDINSENQKRWRQLLTSLATISSTSRRLLIMLSHIFDSGINPFGGKIQVFYKR